MAIQSCCVDIETSHLCADFGVILCGVVKPDGREPVVIRGDQVVKNWSKRRSDDGQVAKLLAEELSKYDIWVAHNGMKFDIPYINTSLLRAGYKPLARPKTVVDPVQLARNGLRMSYNSLEKIAQVLGVNTKTQIEPRIWLKAILDGCKGSMDYIVEHCVEDVETLESVVTKLKDLCSGFNNWGSGR